MTKSNSNVKQAVPFFMVTNMERSLRFYREILNFEVINTWEPNGTIEWCLIQLGNASVMLQEFKQAPVPTALGEGVSVYFICDDALAIYHGIVERGGSAAEPFVGNNMWVVSLKDPNGYNILFESATVVPEGTTFTEWEKIAEIK